MLLNTFFPTKKRISDTKTGGLSRVRLFQASRRRSFYGCEWFNIYRKSKANSTSQEQKKATSIEAAFSKRLTLSRGRLFPYNVLQPGKTNHRSHHCRVSSIPKDHQIILQQVSLLRPLIYFLNHTVFFG